MPFNFFYSFAIHSCDGTLYFYRSLSLTHSLWLTCISRRIEFCSMHSRISLQYFLVMSNLFSKPFLFYFISTALPLPHSLTYISSIHLVCCESVSLRSRLKMFLAFIPNDRIEFISIRPIYWKCRSHLPPI